MSLEKDEPQPKRLKMDDESNMTEKDIDFFMDKLNMTDKNLSPIIDNIFYGSIPLVKVYIGIIKNPKDISKTIIALNDNLPLKELQHLKRVRRKEVLLCQVEFLNGNTVEQYLEANIDSLKDVFECFKEAEVPSLPPKIRRQFEESNKLWPCNFHPNKYHEKIASGAFFAEEELISHRRYMAVAFEAVKFYLNKVENHKDLFKDINAAVVVDPSIQSIVAVAINNKKHPIQHAAMLAIDNVAKTQNGGAWVASESKADISLCGINKDLYCHLKERFSHLKFGAKEFRSKRNLSVEEIGENIGCGPYLCTGYYIYLIREPCVMCSMGLIHARVNRVFFGLENENLGALKSKTKLQTVTSLNHHFEVFSGFF